MSLLEQGVALLLVGVGLCGTVVANAVLSGGRAKGSQASSVDEKTPRSAEV